MKLNNLRRIVVEDYPSDYNDLIKPLAQALNPTLEQMSFLFNKNIDFDNLNQEVISFQFKAKDATGIPNSQTQIKTSLKTKIKGVVVINAQNLEGNQLLTGCPFINYDLSDNLLTVKQITGLPENKTFNITIIVVG